MEPRYSRWVFLDRDGVLVKDRKYVYKTEDLEILPNVFVGLRKLKELGFKFIIVTNQAGIARGLYTAKDAENFNAALVASLKNESIHIEKAYFCRHHPDFNEKCDCRKPSIGLAEQAAKEFGICLAESVFVGDKDSDTEFGKRCGGETFRIANGEYPNTVKADHEVSDLLEVAEILEKEAKKSSKDF